MNAPLSQLKSWMAALRLQTGALAVVAVLGVAGFFLVPKTEVLGGRAAVAYGETIVHHIGPMSEGRVLSLNVSLGQHVKAGEVIATLENPQLQVSLERTKAELAEAEADVLAANEDEMARVIRGELLVLRTRTTEREDRAELKELSRRMQRLDGLLAKQVIPASEVEDVRERERALSARVKTYDQAIGRGEAGLNRNGHRNGGMTPIDARMAPYHQAVLVQQWAIRELENALAQLTLRAPVDGVVADLVTRPGDVVNTGDEVVSLVSGRPGVIVAMIPERAASSIQLGQHVSVKRSDLLARALDGQVIELSPLVEEVPQRARPSPHIPAWGRRVVIQLPSTQEVLPGEPFRVSL